MKRVLLYIHYTVPPVKQQQQHDWVISDWCHRNSISLDRQ